MKYIVFAVWFFACFISSAQDENTNGDIPYFVVENMPCLPECMPISDIEKRNKCVAEEIDKFIVQNLKHPEVCIVGSVYLQFIINKEGKVEDVALLRGIHDVADKEALRVVKSLPQFIPGTQNGKAVRVKYTVGVKFGE